VLVDARGQPDALVVLAVRGGGADGEGLPVTLQFDGVFLDAREVGDEPNPVVRLVDVYVGLGGEPGAVADGAGTGPGHLVHHPFDLVENVAERVVTVVASHTFP